MADVPGTSSAEADLAGRNRMNAAELFGHWKPVRDGLIEALDKLNDE
jgi:hypothetical protein